MRARSIPQGLESLREKPISRLKGCRGTIPSPLRGCESLLGYFPGFRPPSAVADDGLHPGLFSHHPSGMLLPLRGYEVCRFSRRHQSPRSIFVDFSGPTQVVPLLQSLTLPLLQSPTQRVFRSLLRPASATGAVEGSRFGGMAPGRVLHNSYVLPQDQSDRIQIVLVSPRNPLNMGAAARAMANFGFTHLSVVTPWEPHWREAKSAVGAESILEAATVAGSIPEAVADCTLVVGTGSLEYRKPEQTAITLPDLAPLVGQELARGGRVALRLRPGKARAHARRPRPLPCAGRNPHRSRSSPP